MAVVADSCTSLAYALTVSHSACAANVEFLWGHFSTGPDVGALWWLLRVLVVHLGLAGCNSEALAPDTGPD